MDASKNFMCAWVCIQAIDVVNNERLPKHSEIFFSRQKVEKQHRKNLHNLDQNIIFLEILIENGTSFKAEVPFKIFLVNI